MVSGVNGRRLDHAISNAEEEENNGPENVGTLNLNIGVDPVPE